VSELDGKLPLDLDGKLPLDPGILTPGDMKRLKVSLGGQSPTELMNDAGTLWQVLLLAVKLRTDPAFTFEQAEETPLGSVFDVTGGGPPTSPSPSGTAGSSRPSLPAGGGSRKKRTSSAPAPSSAASTG